jgi:hypothetical protein
MKAPSWSVVGRRDVVANNLKIYVNEYSIYPKRVKEKGKAEFGKCRLFILDRNLFAISLPQV